MEFMVWFYTKGFILFFALIACGSAVGLFIKHFWAKPGELGPEPKGDWDMGPVTRSKVDILVPPPAPRQSLEEKFDMRLTNVFRRWDE